MTATATYSPDLLDELDAMARTSFTVPGEIRAAWLEAIQAISDRDGDWDSGRVRVWLDSRGMEWAHGSQSGATVTALVRSGAAVDTGRMALLGNTKHRAGKRRVPVYRLTRRVWPEVSA